MKKLMLALLATTMMLPDAAQATVTYAFSFTDLLRVDNVAYPDFALTLTGPTYITTSGLAPLGTALPTSLGYSVTYGGTNNIGWFFFSNGNGMIDDGGIFYDGISFSFMPDITVPGQSSISNYIESPGTYQGFLTANIQLTYPGGVNGRGTLTVTDDGVAAVPEPASWAMMIGGFSLVGAAMRRRRVAVRYA